MKTNTPFCSPGTLKLYAKMINIDFNNFWAAYQKRHKLSPGMARELVRRYRGERAGWCLLGIHAATARALERRGLLTKHRLTGAGVTRAVALSSSRQLWEMRLRDQRVPIGKRFGTWRLSLNQAAEHWEFENSLSSSGRPRPKNGP